MPIETSQYFFLSISFPPTAPCPTSYTSILAFCARVHYLLATAFTRLFVSLPNTPPPFVRVSDISLFICFIIQSFRHCEVTSFVSGIIWRASHVGFDCTSRLKAISLVSCISPYQIVAETNHVRETGHEVSK